MKKLSKKFIFGTMLFLALGLVTPGCTTTSNNMKETQAPVVTKAAEPNAKQRIFTVDELKKYDGQNGNPAYVAINGKVYDVTNAKAWKNAVHKGNKAGNDLSSVINQSPHGTSVLKDLPVVGNI